MVPDKEGGKTQKQAQQGILPRSRDHYNSYEKKKITPLSLYSQGLTTKD